MALWGYNIAEKMYDVSRPIRKPRLDEAGEYITIPHRILKNMSVPVDERYAHINIVA